MKATKYVSAITLCMVALVAAPAYAATITNYTINFTTTFGGPPAQSVSGSFTYNSTNPQFSSFLVSFGAITFDLTASANSPLTSGVGCTGETVGGPSFAFQIISQTLSGCSGGPPTYLWQGFVFQTTNTPTQFSFNAISIFGVGRDEIFSSLGSANQQYQGSWSITPVVATPEPSSISMLVTGLLGLMGMGLYKKRLA